MKISLLLVVSVSIALAKEDASTFLATNAIPGEFPFVATLQLFSFGQSAHFCAGAIIGDVWILTAASCITNLPQIGTVEVLVGAHNLAEREQGVRVLHSVSRTHIHPGWRIFARNEPNDIALVRLWTPITFNERVQRIRLPQPAAVAPVGPLTFAGWGDIGIRATVLRRASLTTISVAYCDFAINNLNFNGRIDTVNETNICTGPLTGAFSACNGDFGGPLIDGSSPNQVLVGIASWGVTPCGTVGAPSAIFTRVSAFTDWITATTGISP